MFGLFKRKEPDKAKVEEFCKWFGEHANAIVDCFKKSAGDGIDGDLSAMLDEVEKRLAAVYCDGYGGEIEFEYGFNPTTDKWDLNLYHLGKKFLIAATGMIKTELEKTIGDSWNINISK